MQVINTLKLAGVEKLVKLVETSQYLKLFIDI